MFPACCTGSDIRAGWGLGTRLYFSGQWNYQGYTHVWTKLHTEVISWIWHLWVSLYACLTWCELNYCVWFLTVMSVNSLLVSVIVCSHIGVELDSEGPSWQLWIYFSMCANLKSFISIRSIEFFVYGYTQANQHTHVDCNAVPLMWGLLRFTQPITVPVMVN